MAVSSFHCPLVPRCGDPMDSVHGKGLLLGSWLTVTHPSMQDKLAICSAIAEDILGQQRSGKVYSILTPYAISVLSEPTGVRVAVGSLDDPDSLMNKPVSMNLKTIREVLPYLSPERSGMMCHGGDNRSIFYSLGAIFYEIFSGSPPFIGSDPLKLMHGHMAKQPPCLTVNVKNLPLMVSRLILKLLSKDPEDRYQGLKSLVSDLKRCARDYERHGDVSYFHLGSDDIPDELRFPRKLYGRDQDMDKLVAVYERVANGGMECLFVVGEPGVGKTSLIHEFGRCVKDAGGYFAAGKYDPLGNRIPYNGLKACLRDMVRQILTEKSGRLAYWRHKLVPALSAHGKIITDDIPDLEYVAGKQREIPNLGTVEVRNRFRDVYSNVIKALPDRDHPVVLFVDDLQWADTASLEFIRWFLSDERPRHLLLVGSIRCVEGYPGSRGFEVPEAFRFLGAPITTVFLHPMGKDSVDHLIRDTLKDHGNGLLDLGAMVHEKTAGNPFLVKSLIRSLYDSHRLRFDDDAGKWVWDLRHGVGPGILKDQEVMDMLPGKTLVLLFAASCAGNRFTLKTVAALCGETHDQTLSDLDPAMDRFLVAQVTAEEYEFTHDRIRLTIYGMIPRNMKKRLHLGIGREALKDTWPGQGDERIFYTVHHMNRGSELLVLDSEKEELARLNLSAALRARKSTALAAACRHCRVALGLLSGETWDRMYPLVFQLYMVLAECEYLMGNTTEAERIFDTELVKAKWRLDKARVINLRIILYTAGGRIEEAFQWGIEGLKLFSEAMPERPGKKKAVMEYVKTWLCLSAKRLDTLSFLPELTDQEKMEVVNLYTNMGTPAYYLGPEFFATVVVKAVRFCLKNGTTPAFSMAMISFGLVTCFGFGLYKSGFTFAEQGMKLLSSMNDTTFKARAYFIFGFFIVGWREHAMKSVQVMRLARHYGMETGALIYSGHSINAVFMTRMIAGEKIDDITPEFESCQGLMKRLNDPFITGNYMDNLQMVRALKETGGNVNSDVTDRREKDIRSLKNPLALFMFLNIRLRCDYFFGNLERGMRTSEKIRAIGNIPVGALYLAEYCFYDSLTLSACAFMGGHFRKKDLVRRLKNNRAKMKTWTGLCPQNFEHKYLLVAAEIKRIEDQRPKALALYRRAAVSAKKNGYIQNAGLAHKLMADCLLDMGEPLPARAHLEEAMADLADWGADAVVKHLQTSYAGLLTKKDSTPALSLSRLVDDTSVAHSLRAISTEMNLKSLLRKTLLIAMENAGATRGIYLSAGLEGLFIEAERWAESPDVQGPGMPVPLESRDDLLTEAVYYTFRTGRPVILKDAASDSGYMGTAYVASTGLKSVLVLPVFRQQDMTGILYLENRMAAGVFTDQRLETLRLIASQSAISVENARLFEAVIQKEDRLRALSAELMITEERARRNIAVELHDGIGHALTTVRMTLAMAQDSNRPEEIRKAIGTVFDILDRCSQDVQSLTFDLSPPVLYDFGLMAALEWLSNKTREQHGLAVEIRGCPQIGLSESVSVTLFQIVRELVFNCVKHARATKITVSVIQGENRLTVTVEDDGIGIRSFPGDGSFSNGSFGLFSIRERIRYMNGEFLITSSPGNGTRITFTVPVSGPGWASSLKPDDETRVDSPMNNGGGS